MTKYGVRGGQGRKENNDYCVVFGLNNVVNGSAGYQERLGKQLSCIRESKLCFGGTWVAQWVKASTFGSGHDPGVLGSSPALGSLLGRKPASSSLSACSYAYL